MHRAVQMLVPPVRKSASNSTFLYATLFDIFNLRAPALALAGHTAGMHLGSMGSGWASGESSAGPQAKSFAEILFPLPYLNAAWCTGIELSGILPNPRSAHRQQRRTDVLCVLSAMAD